MKKIILAALVTMLASTNLQAQNSVTTSTVSPATGLLAAQPNGGSQYLVDAVRDPGQGQTFSLDSDFTIESLTIQIGTDTRGAQDTAEDAAALSLNIYQLPVDPVSGLPVLTLDATTLLGSFSDSTAPTFDATAANNTPLFLTFDLDAASTASLGTLSANTVYAFTITTNSMTDPSFRIERSLTNDFANGDGIFTGGNNIPVLRDMDDAVFFLQGTGDTFDLMPVVLGDVNCDGSVDFLDIAPFIALLSSGEFLDKADINEDASVDFLDIAPFIGILSS